VHLVARLQDAAAAAIENERPALESLNGHLRGVTIELVPSSTGQVYEAIGYMERRPSGAGLLPRRAARKGPAA
jgi:hypothetical protein